MSNEQDDKNLLIRLRPETRAKFDAIAGYRRWTLAETADALADEYLKQHGIRLPGAAKPTDTRTVPA